MEKLIKRLKTDPKFLQEVIVWNNYNEVLTNFSTKTDADLGNEESILLELENFQNDGFGDVVAEVLNVPFDEENASEKLKNAYNSLRDSSGNMYNGLLASVQAAIDKDNQVNVQVTTAAELTTKNAPTQQKEVTEFKISVKNIFVMALIIIGAMFLASKIKL